MNASQEKALFHLTGQSDLSRIQESTLNQMATEFPYFAPIHLFLAEKRHSIDDAQFETASQKANLYFTNPYWLHYQLRSHSEKLGMPEGGFSLENIIHQTNQSNYTVLSKEAIQELPTASLETTEILDPLLAAGLEENSPEIPLPTVPAPNSMSNDFNIPTIERVKEMMRGIDKPPFIENTDSLPSNIPTLNPISPLVVDVPRSTTSIEDAFKTKIEPVSAFVEPSINTTAAFQNEAELESELPISEDYDETAATALSNSKISSLLSGQLANFKKPITDADQLGLPKDPMHTIDYFASQGIKIDLSQIPQDKLTTHLRKFTEWLKYIKSENPNPIDLGTRKDLEEAVAIIAHSSNESKEVLTESMADVLQKQGQIDKSIQLYIKLSFLNPEKSAYFAAKIQHLKGIQ